jgi:hypothetical protein
VLDELQIHQILVLLGGDRRLFDERRRASSSRSFG